MVSLFLRSDEVVTFGKYISISTAANRSGYSDRYLRRLLRSSKLRGIKISRIWLVEAAYLHGYLNNAHNTPDLRWGPGKDFPFRLWSGRFNAALSLVVLGHV